MRSVLDRLDREDVRLHQPRYLTLPLSVYEGTWITLSPSRFYASPRWILRVHRIFFEITAFPTVASEPGLCLDVICTSRAQRVVGDNSHAAYQHVIL